MPACFAGWGSIEEEEEAHAMTYDFSVAWQFLSKRTKKVARGMGSEPWIF
jgi:hypothetical protein